MGSSYAFHTLDPGVVADVTFTPADELVQRLQLKGVSPEAVGCSGWGDELDLNEVLSILATTQSWDIDWSLATLIRVCRLSPTLVPVRSLFRHMEDLQAASIPAEFGPRECGLLGIALPPAIEAAFGAIEPFSGDKGRAAFEFIELSVLRTLLSGRLRSRLLADEWLWRYWNCLADALRTAHERQEWLALHMAYGAWPPGGSPTTA